MTDNEENAIVRNYLRLLIKKVIYEEIGIHSYLEGEHDEFLKELVKTFEKKIVSIFEWEK